MRPNFEVPAIRGDPTIAAPRSMTPSRRFWTFPSSLPADAETARRRDPGTGRQSLPIISVGQFAIPTAYRATLSGIVASPVIVMWNVEKK